MTTLKKVYKDKENIALPAKGRATRKGVKQMKKFKFNGTIYENLTDAQDAAYFAALSSFYNNTEDSRGNPISLDGPHCSKALSTEEVECFDCQLNDLVNSFFAGIEEIDVPDHATEYVA